MTRPFRFGLQVRQLDDHDAIVAAARQAEQLGYDDFFSYDHVGTIDPFVPLMVAAEATTRLRVGPLVINNELHHPALLARTAATVDRLTGGRLVLGMGTGYQQSEHDAVGIELRPPKERVDRFGESLAALRSLLDTGAAHVDGEHVRLSLDRLGVRPVQERLPILVGGHGRRVVRFAAQHADIFQFTGLTHGDGGAISTGGFALAEVDRRAAWLREDAGDRDADIERSILVQLTIVGDDATDRLDETAAELEVDRQVVEETPFVLIGSVAQIVDELGRLRERLGVSHVLVRDAEGFAPVVAALAGR